MRKTLLILALTSLAWTADAANLSDIYHMARKKDAQYAAAVADYKANMEKLPQGRSQLLPVVGLSAEYNHYDTDIHYAGLANSSRSYSSPTATFALRQPIYHKQYLETLGQAKLQVQLADAQLKAAEQNLMLRSSQAYFDVLQAQVNLESARIQKTAIAEQLELAKKSFEVGAATIVDTHEAQARYDAAVAEEIVAGNDLDLKRWALEKLIMEPAPELAWLAEHYQVAMPEPNNMDSWVQLADQNNLNVRANQYAAEIAGREVERQRAGFLPTVDLNASYTTTRDSYSGNTKIDSTGVTQVGVRLDWNLYQGGATSSLVREAVANKEKASANLDNATRQAQLDARQSFLGVVAGDARVRALEQAVKSNETQLRSTRLGQEVGVRTAVDVLNAQQSLYLARRDLASARYAALISSLNLKAVAGGLTEDDLKAVDALLTEAH